MVETASISTKTFDLEVISPERVLIHTSARMIVVEASDGELGILANHAPLVSAIVPSVLDIVLEDGKKQTFAVGEGFLEVFKNRVKVLVDSAERPEDIDVERARKSRERAEVRLKARADKDIDFRRAELALQRAVARLKVTASLEV